MRLATTVWPWARARHRMHASQLGRIIEVKGAECPDIEREARLRIEWDNELWPSGYSTCKGLQKRIRKHWSSKTVAWFVLDNQSSPLAGAWVRPFRPGAAHLEVYVTPTMRRRGAARRLFAEVSRYARAHGTVMFNISTSDAIPAGGGLVASADGFVTGRLMKWEAQVTPPGTYSLDRVNESAPRNVQFELIVGCCHDPSRVLQLAELRAMVVERYNGFRPSLTNPLKRKRVIDAEGKLSESNVERCTICAVDASHRCIGYSEYMFDPDEPSVLAHVGLAVADHVKDHRVALSLLRARDGILATRRSVRCIRYVTQLRASKGPCTMDDKFSGTVWRETAWMLPLRGLESLLH